ncbi:phosphotransferase family protein [Kitasatospora gansuensis]
MQSRQGAAPVGIDYPSGGFTPGIAARVDFTDGSRVFVKGIALNDRTARHYEAEAAVGPYLPPSVAPELLWSIRAGGWLLNAYEDIAGTIPDLSPTSPDLTPALSVIGLLRDELTPCPAPGIPPVSTILAELTGGWATLADKHPEALDPWERRHLAALLSSDDSDLLTQTSAGATLLHCDLRPDNLLIGGHRVRVIDWSWATRGAAWVDAAFLVPQLILAGHTPEQAEDALAAHVPAWKAAPPAALTSFAIAVTGYWRRHHVNGPGGALGDYRRRAAEAGQHWITHRTGWA